MWWKRSPFKRMSRSRPTSPATKTRPAASTPAASPRNPAKKRWPNSRSNLQFDSQAGPQGPGFCLYRLRSTNGGRELPSSNGLMKHLVKLFELLVQAGLLGFRLVRYSLAQCNRIDLGFVSPVGRRGLGG